jgi:hypothetical protein
MRTLLLLVCIATGLVTLAGGAARGASRPSFLFVNSSTEEPAGKGALQIVVSLAAGSPTTEGFTVTAPAGYVLPHRAVGAQMGIAAVNVRNATRTLPGPLVGALVVADPVAALNDPVLRACAPGSHAEAWQLMLTGSVEATVPIAVDRLASGGSYRLTVCLDGLQAVQLVPVRVDVDLVDVSNPAAAGVYDWSALVTPFDTAGHPDFASATELRAHVPLPQSLTLKASYDPRTKRFTARGTLLMAGKARVGARINVHAFAADGLSILYLGTTQTTRTGAYVFRKRLATRPKRVAADVEIATAPCESASTAPKGCASESVPGADSGSVRVTLSTTS